MATYYFNCSICNKSVSARSKYYKIYLGRYDCYNEEELSKHYVCKICKKRRGERIFKKRKSPFNLQENPKFSEIEGFISLEAIKLKEIGLHNELARENFLENVKLVLAKEGISKYNFIIENNELIGINIKIPIVGDVVMKINTEKEL